MTKCDITILTKEAGLSHLQNQTIAHTYLHNAHL